MTKKDFPDLRSQDDLDRDERWNPVVWVLISAVLGGAMWTAFIFWLVR